MAMQERYTAQRADCRLVFFFLFQNARRQAAREAALAGIPDFPFAPSQASTCRSGELGACSPWPPTYRKCDSLVANIVLTGAIWLQISQVTNVPDLRVWQAVVGYPSRSKLRQPRPCQNLPENLPEGITHLRVHDWLVLITGNNLSPKQLESPERNIEIVGVGGRHIGPGPLGRILIEHIDGDCRARLPIYFSFSVSDRRKGLAGVEGPEELNCTNC